MNQGGIHVLLVVEDDPDIRLLIALVFGANPAFHVEGELSTAEEALEFCRSHRPDLVILDHKLEGELTGLEAAPRIKELVPSAHIILFSASEELREAAKDEPAIDAFILKTQIDRLVPVSEQLLS